MNRKLFIGLVIFTALAIGSTIGAILWHNNLSDDEQQDFSLLGTKEEINEQDENFYNEKSKLVVHRGDVYATNQLRVTYAVGDKDPFGYDVTYPQISGLKDQEIQGKINDEIKASFEQINSGELAKGANRKTISCGVQANFANILSVKCERKDTYRHIVTGTGEVFDKIADQHAYLNYRLDTGEKLKFNDVFLAGSNMNALATTAFYETWAGSSDNWECAVAVKKGEYCPKEQPVYPADIEERALVMVREFQKQSETDFYITSTGVTFRVGGEEYTLNFLDSSNQIAIYKRFAAANNLFTDEVAPMYGVVFREANNDRLGQIGDNLFVDCINFSSDDSMRQQIVKLIDQKVLATEQTASANANQAFLLTCYAEVSKASDGFRTGETQITFSSSLYKMPKTYYEQTMKAKMIDELYKPRSSLSNFTSLAFTDIGSGQITDKSVSLAQTEKQVWYQINGAWKNLTDDYRAWGQNFCVGSSGWGWNSDTQSYGYLERSWDDEILSCKNW